MNSARIFFVLAASIALAGCASDGERPRYPADATVYPCDAGKTLVVRYVDGGKSVMIVYPEREFRLDKVPAGTRYTNGRTTLHLRTDSVALEENGQPLFTECKVLRPAGSAEQRQ
jgi:hypothetical protein